MFKNLVLFVTFLALGCHASNTQSPPTDQERFTPDHGAAPVDQFLLNEVPCNGRDDDRDGTIDESELAGSVCQIELPHCTRSGQYQCDGFGALVCLTGTSEREMETCNGLDDDCDGRIDEDFDVHVPCTKALGECGPIGYSVCASDGRSVVCDAPVNMPQAELCNGLDEDCDGIVDEGFMLGGGCSIGQGLCVSEGVFQCTATGGVSCMAPEIEALDEQCNRIDDDCDGSIDEGACTQTIITNCEPQLLWRTDLYAQPMPIDVNTCTEQAEENATHQCSVPVPGGLYGLLELPFRNNSVILGYGFGITIQCTDREPDWLFDILEQDCTIYYGFDASTNATLMNRDTLSVCPRERSSGGTMENASCSSQRIGANESGLEFEMALPFGVQIGFGIECRQTIDDPENAIWRGLINDELQLEMGWSKSDATFLVNPQLPWPGCETASDPSQTTCARSNEGGLFGLLKITNPAHPGDARSDIMGIRFLRKEHQDP